MRCGLESARAEIGVASRTMAVRVWFSVALFLMGCTDRRVAADNSPLKPCVLSGIPREAECGSVFVREDAGSTKELGLRVARIPARAKGGERHALFLLAGGPGQAATVAFPKLWPVFAALAETRDIVMIDARGTGESAALDCPKVDDLAAAFRAGSLQEAARNCRPLHASRNLDAYGTDALALDLETVRKALGYGPVDVLGISYGTRLALAYAARFPDNVRSLVLDAVAPPELVLGGSFGRDGEAALDRLFVECAADASCGKAFPDARANYVKVLERLGRAPETLELRHPDSDAPLHVRVERDGLAAIVRSLLYAPELAALLPMTLSEVEHGNYQGLLQQAAVLSHSADEGMSLGLLFSVACAEDIPRLAETDRVAERATLLGTSIIEDFQAACALWPVHSRPLAPLPAVLLVPTLLLSGALDPVTPPHWAEALRARLPRSLHVVVPEAGHSVWARGCVPGLVERFIERGHPDGLDTACAARHQRPAFFIDRAGPSP